jgi:hypothetical protein
LAFGRNVDETIRILQVSSSSSSNPQPLHMPRMQSALCVGYI